MKHFFSIVLAGLCFLQPGFAQTQQASAKLHTLSPYFTFTAKAAPHAALHTGQTKGELVTGNTKQESFTIKMLVNLQPFAGEQTLLEIPGLLYI
ncbi:MAG TPA: hypothetical protein PLL71_07810, partial [Agriterribacter sp.]|nr:hypothetical protein [Agriterribacter sp.]